MIEDFSEFDEETQELLLQMLLEDLEAHDLI